MTALTTNALTTNAPGKLNLCLYLGATRDDGLHELVSLFESVSLHDTVTMIDRPELDADLVVCAGVEGDNLAGCAVALARSRGFYDGPSAEITIDKRIPVAAGMGGGSADAAATLRLIAARTGIELAELGDIAFELGADVPSQLTPGAAFIGGAGEVVEQQNIATDAPRAYVIVAQEKGLSTADVFRAADAARLARPALDESAEALRTQLGIIRTAEHVASLIENDLSEAILDLRPELGALPMRLLGTGALAAEFTGSGPTCFAIYQNIDAATQAAEALRSEGLLAHAAESVGADFATVRPLAEVPGR